MTLFLIHCFQLLLFFEFVKNFNKGANIVVRLFAEWHVDKCESVEGSEGCLIDKLKLNG